MIATAPGDCETGGKGVGTISDRLEAEKDEGTSRFRYTFRYT